MMSGVRQYDDTGRETSSRPAFYRIDLSDDRWVDIALNAPVSDLNNGCVSMTFCHKNGWTQGLELSADQAQQLGSTLRTLGNKLAKL